MPSGLERIYSFLHNKIYRRRLKSQKRFPGHYIVSIGNLSAGGTGKTPVAVFLASRAKRLQPLICLRGYGGSLKEGSLVSDGKTIFLDAGMAGDEALLLAEKTGAAVAAGSNRAELIEKFGEGHRVVLLDDAFQNPSVYRDHELVLIDASVPVEKIKLLPTGKFRDSIDALRRADTVLLTRIDQSEPDNLKRLRERISSVVSAEHVFESIHEVTGLDPEIPEGAAVGAFCAIGNPDSFFSTVEKIIPLKCRFPFPDHHMFTAGELTRIKRQGGPSVWVTTEKDYVRLRSNPRVLAAAGPLHVLKIQLKILRDREEEFVRRVFRGIEV